MKIRKIIHTTLSTVVALALGASAWLSASASTALDPDSIAARLDRQRWIYPQEKVHVTTDQARYVAGDTVWLRAWVVDAASHEQVAASRYVYIELADPFGNVVDRVKIREQDGRFPGHLPLNPDLAEGDYTLSAYTAFMEGPGNDFFFRKKLGVVSPYAADVSPEISFDNDNGRLALTASLRDNGGSRHWYESLSVTSKDGRVREWRKSDRPRRVALSEEDIRTGTVLLQVDNYRKFITLPADEGEFDISFHPEGGYFIPGTACRVGIKAIDSAGRGIDIKGTLLDSAGAVVDSFHTVHRGMGELSFVPSAGAGFRVIAGGREFALPDARADACALHVDNSRASAVTATAVGNLPAGAFMVVQNRGRAVYAGSVAKDIPVIIPRKFLGEGIVQFLLLDPEGRPLSERLAFNRGEDLPTPSAFVSDSAGEKSLVVEFPEEMIGADVAIAVIDASVAEADSAVTIQSQLLLQGDLRGHVEDAGWYFRNRGRAVDMALDALMMTQGWRRYDIPAVASGQFAEPQSAIEAGPEITGVVKSRWRGKPMEGATVNILAPSIDYAGIAVTDSEGRFAVADVDFPEDTKFVVQALNPKGDNEHNFEVDEQSFPVSSPLAPEPGVDTSGLQNREDRDIDYSWRVSHINGQMSVTLGEITVKRHKRSEPEDIYEILASKTFTAEQLEKDHVTSYEEALRKIPGLIISNGNVTFRKRNVGFRVDEFPWSSSTDDQSTQLGSSRQTSQELNIDKYGNTLSSKSFASINRKIAQNRNVSLGMQLSSSIGGKLGEFSANYPFDIISKIQFIHPSESVVFGNYPGGILRFTTKTGEELKHAPSIFLQIISPLGYQKPQEFYVPKYTFNEPLTETRSTLYWQPIHQITDNRTILKLPKLSNYILIVEGFSPNGKIIRTDRKIGLNH